MLRAGFGQFLFPGRLQVCANLLLPRLFLDELPLPNGHEIGDFPAAICRTGKGARAAGDPVEGAQAHVDVGHEIHEALVMVSLKL